MAHNSYGNRVALHGQPAWHNLGVVFQGNKTLKEVLAMSGCDYQITIEQIPNLVINGMEVDMTGRVAIVRHANDTDPTPVMLEIVSDDYKLVTNQELVNWYDELSTTFPVETMGALGSGETFFFTLDMGTVEVNSEAVHRFLLVTDNKVGLQKTRGAITPVRVVCQNTLVTGLRSATVDIQVPHRTGNKERLQQIAGIVKEVKQRADQLDKLFGLMGKTLISIDEFKKIVEETVYPLPAKEELIVIEPDDVFGPNCYKMSREQRDQLAVVDLFQQYNDTMPKEHQGTAWAAWQAVTDNEDWKKGRGTSQFSDALFGKRAATKATAFNAFAKLIK